MKNKQDNESLRMEVERLKSENEALLKKISGSVETNAAELFSKTGKSDPAHHLLKQEDDFMRSLFSAITDSVIVADKDLKVVEVNPGMEKMFGYKREDIIGKDVVSLIMPEKYVEAGVDAIKRALNTGVLKHKGGIIEAEGRKKNGEVFPMEHTASIMKIGGDIYFIAVLRDTSDRKLLLAETKRSFAVFRGLIEASPDAIIMSDDKQNIIVWNPGAEKLFGYKKEEVMNADYVNLVVPQKIIPVRDKAFQEAIKTGRLAQPGQTIETEGKRKDGTIFSLEHTVSIWNDTETGDIYIIAVLRDITKRIRIENEKNRISSELVQLIETANAPIFGIDKEGRINEWNQTTVRITGFSKEEVTGNDLVEGYITEEYKVSVKTVLDKALKGEETANYELPLCTKDGKRVMVLLNTTTRRDVDGNVVGVIGIGQDITELDKHRNNLESIVEERTAELNLSLADAETARDKIDGILKSVADGLIVTDSDNRVVLMNRAVEDMLNVRFSEVINRPIDYAIKDETLRDRMKSTLNKEQTGYEFDFELPDNLSGQTRIMRARTSVIQGKDGRQQGIVTIIMDVTHERDVDRMKTEFLSTAAHELRTPLTSIMGFSEIILTRDNISPEERRKFLTYINEQSVGLNRIISDLLDISRIESGRGFILNKQPCEGGSAIKGVVSLFQEKHPKRQFEIVLPRKPVNIIADKDKMAQVLKNLISNSVKYSPEGGKIRLTGKVIDGCFQVSVEDHGMGMTPEQVEKVFDKFYRVDASNTAIEGTGLGMSIVKHIVEAHGGKVWVESEYGKGTTVTFRIPL